MRKSTPANPPELTPRPESGPTTRQWRNRIVGHGEEDPKALLANPKNWRIHPKAQQAALRGVLSQVGWVQDVIINKRTGYIVDGHARVDLALQSGEAVPVVYVDLSEEEERLILATIDPLSAMAVSDAELFAGLVTDLKADESALADLIAMTAGNSAGKTRDANETGIHSAADGAPVIQYNIVFNSEAEQKIWFEFLKTLRIKFPDLTISERIIRFIRGDNQG